MCDVLEQPLVTMSTEALKIMLNGHDEDFPAAAELSSDVLLHHPTESTHTTSNILYKDARDDSGAYNTGKKDHFCCRFWSTKKVHE